MQCADLDRYLEAFVDGRLGRSRTTILRRHVTGCGRCRARIERLRQFEREIQGRFRSIGEVRSVWHGLEQDLVRSSAGGGSYLPPPNAMIVGASRARDAVARPVTASRAAGVPRGSGRRRVSRLAGFVALALAAGAIWQIASQWLGGPSFGSAELTSAPDMPVLPVPEPEPEPVAP